MTDFLREYCQFEKATIEMIIFVIDNMGFTSEMTNGSGTAMSDAVTIYLHIVQDADRRDAMGAIGVSRCLAFSGAFGRAIVTPEGTEEREQRARFKTRELTPSARKGPSAISHFYDKLVFLKDMLKTPAGKQLGERRHQFLLSFLDEFFDEIGE